MRLALWLLGLFGVAVAIALFAGNNQGTITVFWPPYRIDLSLNLVLLLLVALFVFLHLALRALSALLSLPREARRWRAQQKERTMHVALLDSLSHLLAGRFVRAQKSAEAALRQEEALVASREAPPHSPQLRALAHLLLAESAQSLQNRPLRDAHLKQALEPQRQREQPTVREGAQLRAARWALDDRDAEAALRWLDELAQGAGRRTLALRLRLKAARQARQTQQALDTARLLAKHRAFSASAAQSIVRGLALELVHGAHDPAQLQRAWTELDAAERRMPEVAIQAAQRLQKLGGEVPLARQWLLPVWEQMLEEENGAWPESQRVRLIDVLEAGFGAEETAPDHAWLTRIESAQQARPRDAGLQYLAGMVCLHHQLWGKAQLLLAQAAQGLQDAGQRRRAWRALAQLAEQRGDEAAAAGAWKQAADVR